MPPEIFTEICRLLSPKKSEKIVQKLDNVYEIFMYEIKSTDIEKLPPNLIELIITCDSFYIQSDLVDQLRGIKFTIYANNVIVSQSCTIDLSGVPHTPFLSSAGKDSKGRGLNGENGAAGESGGSFALICKTIKFVDDSILTIKSNGADGQDGQNGGDGDNGINGMDANDGSFRVNETKFGMNFKSSQDHRKMIENFGLKSSKHSSSSTVTTNDGLTGYIYYQPKKSNQYYTFMLVKGEEYGLPGKIGGRGGLGGEGGIPGQISIKIDYNEHPERIKIIQKNGADGKNGIGGLNGSKGRGGSDCWANHSSQFEPTFHIPKEPTKFKICYTEESVNSIYDESTNKYAYVGEDYKITEPSSKNIRNDLPPEDEKSPKCKASPKPLIIIGDITDENSQYSQYLRDCEGGFIKKKIVTPVKNLVFRYTG